jgi:DnaA regulatory inactivator Hda|tara:strand:- start:299 stop:1033 length:735 start_codon:yes stop_codon:yes gene_type:complete
MITPKNPQQLLLDIKLDESVSLENFIKCDSTDVALNILSNIVKSSSISNSFLLWGKEGVGKSYLMHALNRDFLSQELNTAFIVLSDSRMNEPAILQGLDQMDAVFIEDVNELGSSADWESALFNLINQSLINKTKLIFSSNCVALDLQVTLKDLFSRLSAFTAVEIPEITEKEKIEALLQSATRKGLALEEKTVKYILTYTSRNLSDLLRLLSELDEFSLEKKKKLSPALVRELLSQRSSNSHI